MIGARANPATGGARRRRQVLLLPVLLGLAGCVGAVVVGLVGWMPTRGDSDGYIVGLGYVVLLCAVVPALLQLAVYIDGSVAFMRGARGSRTWVRVAIEVVVAGALVMLLTWPVVDAAVGGWWVLVMPAIGAYILLLGLGSLVIGTE
jgi:hypothetical protein